MVTSSMIHVGKQACVMHLYLLVRQRTKSRDPESSCQLPYPFSPLACGVTLPHTVLRKHSCIGGSRERSVGDDAHIYQSPPTHFSSFFPLWDLHLCARVPTTQLFVPFTTCLGRSQSHLMCKGQSS